jgi:hypothetical protein
MRRILILMLSIFTIFSLSGCGTDNDGDTGAGKEENTNKAEKVEVDSGDKDKEDGGIPFNAKDFIVEINPTGVIDSAGGVEYTYSIKNNSKIPVQELSADVKFEFEQGESMVDSVNLYTTLIEGESVHDTATVYPEPASKIKSYTVIAYEVLDKEGNYYEVDLQLDTIDTYGYGANETTEDYPFKIEDFAIEVTPTGKIDTAGGVEYTFNAKNNSPIPVKEISFDVKLELEDGRNVVDNISIYDTLMNGESVGDTETVYPVPPAKIKSYELIGYSITDKDDNVYEVDPRLKLVQTYNY